METALLCSHHLGLHAILKTNGTYLAILYLSINTVLEKCHLEQDYAATSCYCPRKQKKTEVAKMARHTIQLKSYKSRTVIPQKKKKISNEVQNSINFSNKT